MAKKNPLGKGLTSLIGEAHLESGNKRAIETLDINQIIPNPNQPRKYFNQTELEELSDSIKRVGIIQPIIVKPYKDKFEIVAGERRYQAAKQAGLTEVPVQYKDLNDQETIELALIENLQRSNLNPIEEAMGFKALIEVGSLTQEELAKTVSKSRSSIANSLRLLDLPQLIQDMLFEKKLTAGHARAILAIPDNDKRIRFAHKVIDDKLSVRETEKLAPLFSVDNIGNNKRATTPRVYKLAARALRVELNTNVRVKSLKGKNKIEIEFKDEDELQSIINRICQKNG